MHFLFLFLSCFLLRSRETKMAAELYVSDEELKAPVITALTVYSLALSFTYSFCHLSYSFILLQTWATRITLRRTRNPWRRSTFSYPTTICWAPWRPPISAPFCLHSRMAFSPFTQVSQSQCKSTNQVFVFSFLLASARRQCN